MKRCAVILAAAAFLFSICGISSAKLSDETVEKKEEGWYITGLPLVNYTTDTGIGYGARLYLYGNGTKSDQYFDEVPYFTQIYAQFFQTTNGFSYHELNLDKHRIFGTRYRIISALVYDRKTNENFYGVGSDVTRHDLVDINGNEYTKYEDYQKFLKSNDYQYYKYNNYQYEKPKFYFRFFGDIIENIKFLTGFEVKWSDIDTWNGKKFEASDGHDHVSSVTLLDMLKNDVEGFDGGWINSVKVGVAYDTRDYEPDPAKGLYIDYSFLAASKLIGSDYDFYRSTAGARAYITIFSPLVLALRAAYTDTSGETPFHETQNFEFLFEMQEGLGSNRTMRGYPGNRFVAETMTLGNAELRFRFAEITPFGQRFAFKLLGFVDTGNAYDEAGDPFSDPRWGDYRYCYGGGLVIAWNLATIIHVYYGQSEETSAISVDFNHAI